MKGKKCTLILNTRWGYCCSPMQCSSISEAMRTAKAAGMPYRIFVNGKLYKSGWSMA